MRTGLLKVALPLVLLAALIAVLVPIMSAQNVPRWLAQDDNWAESKATLQAFGEGKAFGTAAVVLFGAAMLTAKYHPPTRPVTVPGSVEA